MRCARVRAVRARVLWHVGISHCERLQENLRCTGPLALPQLTHTHMRSVAIVAHDLTDALSFPMAARPSWDVETESEEDADADNPDAGLSDDDDDLTPPEAAERLFEYLEDSFLSGESSAKTVAVLAYFAHKAGVQGSIAKLAMAPGAVDSSYHRKVAKAVGLDDADERLHVIKVPGYRRSDRSRCVLDLAVVPPHERFADEVVADPGLLGEVERAVADDEWSQVYADHPVVQTPGPTVLPGALYVDGVPYSNTDGVIGFWLYNLVSNVRHLCVVVRKRHLCQCGCVPQGWCTINVILTYLAWSLGGLAVGIHPTHTHERKPWPVSEDVRCVMAGSALGFRLAILKIKGDWAEWAHSFGFPSWSSNDLPCPLCHADRSNWLTCEGISTISFPDDWGEETTQAEIETCCRACEQLRRLSAAQHRRVIDNLQYSKAFGGRAIMADLPELGLERGDRVAATPSMLDVGVGMDTLFDDGAAFHNVLFWRTRYQTKVVHRNPLFLDSLGIGVHSMAIDVLHTVHLGVMQRFCCVVLWLCISQNAFRVPARALDETVAATCLIIREQLTRFYATYARMHPAHRLTEIQDITPQMLGKRNKPKLKLKAAETWGFLLWLQHILGGQVGRNLGELAGACRGAADSLVEWMHIIKTSGRALERDIHERLCNCVVRHLACARRLGMRLLPKHHMWVHVTVGAWRQGNPRFYWTFLDESLNGKLKKVLRRCHQAAFERRALAKVWYLFGLGRNVKRRRA